MHRRRLRYVALHNAMYVRCMPTKYMLMKCMSASRKAMRCMLLVSEMHASLVSKPVSRTNLERIIEVSVN